MTPRTWALYAAGIILLIFLISGNFEFPFIVLLWFFLIQPVERARVWWESRRAVQELKAELEVF